MVLRVLVVAAGYLTALAVAPDRVVARIMMWAGIVLVGWPIVDRVTGWSRENVRVPAAGAVALGLGVGAVGVYLALR